MKLTFTGDYLSFKTGNVYEFEFGSGFMILTGLNGSGKSQFLKCLSDGTSAKLEDNNLDKFIHNAIIYKSFRDNSPGLGCADPSQKNDSLMKFWRYYSNLGIDSFNPPNHQAHHFFKSVEKIVKTKFGDEKYNSKTLTLVEIESAIPDGLIYQLSDPFSTNIHAIFQTYVNLKQEIMVNSVEKEILYREDLFIEDYGLPPWDLLNELFDLMNLKYEFDDHYINKNGSVGEIGLFDKSNRSEFRVLDALSDGEKSILSLCIAAFRSQYEKNLPVVKLLILDEYEATLNPSLTKALYFVLNKYFVKFGAYVIISTHCPVTVALAPSNASFYLMERSGESRLSKVTKADSLKLLCGEVLFLDVDFNNKRDVITEDQDDAVYFKTALNTLFENNFILEEKIANLNFIPASNYSLLRQPREKEIQGGCNKVKQTVKIFNNNKITGILDWDMLRKDEVNIFVHGENNRYSIENYIFEPFFLMHIMLSYKIIKCEDLKVTEAEFYKLNEPGQCQKIIDNFFELLFGRYSKKKIDTNSLDQSLVECLYIGESNNKLLLPKWFLQTKGHDLYDKYILPLLPQHFPAKLGLSLNDPICQFISKTYIPKYPNFISQDTLELIKKITDN